MVGDWWTGKWVSDTFGLPKLTYSLIYLGIIIILIFTLVARAFCLGIGISSASYNLVEGMVENILRRNMEFFDTTRSGIILNRCI